MRLILHHAIKDLRAVRGPLALWLAVLIVDVAAQALKIDRFVADPLYAERLVTTFMVAGFSLLGFGWVVAAMVIQADPLDNPSAFWLTRPLPARALLASKLLVVLSLFLLLPAAAASLVVAANGAGGPLVVRFTIERLLVDAALLMPVLVAASVAHNLPRAVLAWTAGILLVSLMRFTFVWQFLAARSASARQSGLLVAMAVAILGGLALLCHQYRTRATRRTLGLSTAAIVLFVAAMSYWPWETVRAASPARVDRDVFDSTAVSLVLDATSLDLSLDQAFGASAGSRVESASGPRVETIAVVRAEGVRAGWVVRVLKGGGELRLRDRVVAAENLRGLRDDADTPYEAGQSARSRFPADVKAAFEHVLGARIVNEVPVADGNRTRLFDLPQQVHKDYQGTSATLQSTVEVQASRVALSQAVRLVPGAACRIAGQDVTVTAVRAHAPWFLKVRHAQPNLATSPIANVHLVVRNRRTGEAFFPRREQIDSTRGFGLAASDMRLTYVSLTLPRTTAVIDERWLADAELVVAVIQPMGTFEAPLVLRDFVLPTSTTLLSR